MILEEMGEVIAAIKARVSSFKPEDTTIKIWFSELRNFDTAIVLTAITEYFRDGNKFAPSDCEISNRVKSKLSGKKVKGFKSDGHIPHALQSYLDKGYFIEGYDHPQGFAWSLTKNPKGSVTQRFIEGDWREVTINL
jgi:hypothetical protein